MTARPADRVPGRATPEGTARFRQRFASLDTGHFRPALGLEVSSIGIGTYLGEPDEETDRGYRTSVMAAVSCGGNVIDSAINYRYQLSERSVGLAIGDIIGSGTAARDELVLCTKGGYLSFDGPPTDARAWVQTTFVDPGIITWPDIVAYNVMVPAYIRHQLATSLANLGVETIDLYYLHNPEAQLSGVPRAEFYRRVAACFEELEAAVAAGSIGCYGVATWEAFRVAADAQAAVSLEQLVRVARDVAGERHHFRAVQMPVSLAMPEAAVSATQQVGDSPVPALEAAARLGLAAIASGSLAQGRLTRLPPGVAALVPGEGTDAQRSLQAARSMPGVATALVGMKTPDHVRENFALAARPPLTAAQFAELFG